jgi:hypothetical protein
MIESICFIVIAIVVVWVAGYALTAIWCDISDFIGDEPWVGR